MANFKIPKWLKGLPSAPEYRPTDTEFADPIAYISKIEKEASAFGICKVIPPLPKPSKRYVFSNLNKSLSESSELGSDDVNLKGLKSDKRNDSEHRAVFTTRQQELGQDVRRSRGEANKRLSPVQKQVWQSGDVYTLEQFESKAKAYSRSVLGTTKDVNPIVVEASFWKAASEKPIYVEYANDVPGSGFGEPEGLLGYFHARKRRRISSQNHRGRSCYMQQDLNTLMNPCSQIELQASAQSSCPFPEPRKRLMDPPASSSYETSLSTESWGVCHNAELEGTAGWKLSNSPWNLQVIARSAGSLTRFMLDNIPGVTSPMVYIGMLFSWFAWHVEDHELHSLNFLHTGSPKTWYAIPGDYAFSFEEVIRHKAYGGDVDHSAALKLLGEKTTLLSPEIVVASGIPCCRLVQNPGEYVVSFPRAYHLGFSHGFNCGEAANFGTPQWLTIAKEAAVRRAAMEHLPMLSHQQLLYLLTMSFISRVPESLLPGVRSSRLRNRLKEERELLVKQAFIEDVLKENNLLNNLLGKGSAFRVVLWHPDSLPSFSRVSLLHAAATADATHTKDAKLSVDPNKDANQDINQLTAFRETVNDYILGSDDLSYDFQIDSGTLPCVACGILGYPFMSVVQPSMKASVDIFSAEHLSVTGAGDIPLKFDSSHLHCSTNVCVSANNDDEKWDTSGVLRPRIFCLEHAVQIEKLLRPKCGVKMLVICHSDYQKIKAHAADVADEINISFNYKEVRLDAASEEELNLIDIAAEQLTEIQEDWTSKLGINLRLSPNAREGVLSKKIELAVDPDPLLPVMAPRSKISSIKWWSRKSRSKRESNHQLIKSSDDHRPRQDEKVHESDGRMEIKGKVLLQYSRRKYRNKSRNVS